MFPPIRSWPMTGGGGGGPNCKDDGVSGKGRCCGTVVGRGGGGSSGSGDEDKKKVVVAASAAWRQRGGGGDRSTAAVVALARRQWQRWQLGSNGNGGSLGKRFGIRAALEVLLLCCAIKWQHFWMNDVMCPSCAPCAVFECARNNLFLIQTSR